MLILANANTELQTKIQECWRQTWTVPKFKYVHSNFWEPISFEDNTWGKEHYAIVDHEAVVGYVEVGISRVRYSATIEMAVDFSGRKAVVAAAFRELFRILKSRNYHKIDWYGVDGNPANLRYSALCHKLGGIVEGVDRDGTRLWDGTYADVYHYGILMQN